MMGRRKLKGNKVWSANRGKVVCREYKFSSLYAYFVMFHLIM